MNLIQWFLSLFQPSVQTGCLLDDPKVFSGLPDHDKFGSTVLKVSKDWTPYCPPFRWQGASLMCTSYSGTSLASIFEKQESGKDILFSPLELFFRSDGGLLGNFISKTADALKVSAVQETDVPTPYIDGWGFAKYSELKRESIASSSQIENGRKYALKTMASVRTDSYSLRAALQDSPLSVIVKVGGGYFNAVAPAYGGYSGALHNALLVKIEDDGRRKIFDSLTVKQGFDGFRWLASDFPIIAAFSFLDLPDSWRDKQPDPIQTFFLSNPTTGEIVPFRSKTTPDYQMWLKAGFIPAN